MEMEQDPFDTDRFIDEIEKRRALWDLESPDYKNRVLKRSAWEEVVDIFSKTESTVEEKKQLGIVLQKRWKNLRDSFARELRKKKTTKSGSGAVKGTPYVYFQRLIFLENTVRNKETTSNLDLSSNSQLPEEEEADTEDLVTPGPINSGESQRKKIKLNPVDKHFSDILTKSIAVREKQQLESTNDDEDKLFCLSLYKELKKIPEQGRIRTKIQLLEVIQRSQECYQPTHHSAPHIVAPPQQNYSTYNTSVPRYYNNPYGQGAATQTWNQNPSVPHFNNPYGQVAATQTSSQGPAISPAEGCFSPESQNSSDFTELYN
ncbi:hypothetical protein J6590_107336 [Homalodisca vitripennis]|nr:hypothetical protein J6590_107336 [Homalodisca vitripennis]